MMVVAHSDLFRELLAAATSSAFYTSLCRVEAVALEGLARLEEALRRLGAPPGLCAAVERTQRDRVQHARLAGMVARDQGGQVGSGPHLRGSVPSRASTTHCDVRQLARVCTMEAWARQGHAALLHASAGGREPLLASSLRSLGEEEARAARVLLAVAGWAAGRAPKPATTGRSSSPGTTPGQGLSWDDHECIPPGPALLPELHAT